MPSHLKCLDVQHITVAKKEWEHKGLQRQHHDASTVAAAVREEAHLGMK